MKRIVYRRPGRAHCSPFPTISLTQESVSLLNDYFKNLPKRMVEGRTLMLMEQANVLRESLLKIAPPIDTMDGEYEYAKDLKIGVIEGVSGEPGVAIWLERDEAVLDESKENEAVLYIIPTGGPPYIAVLAKYGPWPADIMPVVLKHGEAKVVTRMGRLDEVERLRERIVAKRDKIERELADAGAKDPSIDKGKRAVGIKVSEDLANTILRTEFGWGAGKRRAHWRPAIKHMLDNVPKVMKKYKKYLMTGESRLFDLPEEDQVRWEKLKGGMAFQKVLAPFVT